MNPVKWSILGKVTLTWYLGIGGKGCPLPYEIKCFLARTGEDKGDREGIPHTHPIP